VCQVKFGHLDDMGPHEEPDQSGNTVSLQQQLREVKKKLAAAEARIKKMSEE
jgi:hypothetical protein